MMVKRLLLIVFALALSLLFMATTALAQEKDSAGSVQLGEYEVEFDQSFEEDIDDDGVAELTLYYKDNVLVASAEDTNQDGQPDFWLRYTPDWYADMEVRDSDFDGEPDEFVYMDENEQILDVEEMSTSTDQDEDSATSGIVVIASVVAAILVVI